LFGPPTPNPASIERNKYNQVIGFTCSTCGVYNDALTKKCWDCGSDGPLTREQRITVIGQRGLHEYLKELA